MTLLLVMVGAALCGCGSSGPAGSCDCGRKSLLVQCEDYPLDYYAGAPGTKDATAA